MRHRSNLPRAVRLALAAAIFAGCGTPARAPSPTAAPPNRETAAGSASEVPRCYPYLPDANGTCRTSCASIDHCAGSRGPGDLSEHGWPLDCIDGQCVPLPPEHVQPAP